MKLFGSFLLFIFLSINVHSLELKNVFVNKRICYTKDSILLLNRALYPGYYDLTIKIFNNNSKFKIGIVINSKYCLKNFLRKIIRDKIYLSNLSDDVYREFQLTLLLGDKLNKKSEIYKAFYSSGLGHYLAISGVHMTALFVTLTNLFFFLPHVYKLIISFSFVFFYSLSLSSISSFRATIFLFFYLLSELLGEERSLKKIFYISFTICLLFNKITPSFHLSFSAIFALIFLVPIFKIKKLHFFIPSLLVFIVTSIPVLHFFGKVNILSIFYNIAFSTPIMLIIFLSYASLLMPLQISILINTLSSYIFINIFYMLKYINKYAILTLNYSISFEILICFYIFLILFAIIIEKRGIIVKFIKKYNI